MKKIPCLLCTMFVLTAASCDQEQNDRPQPRFAVEPATRALEFDDADDALVHFQVEATGIDTWQALPDRDWIVVAQAADGFAVSVRPFDSYEPSRKGRVTVTADDLAPVQIEVTQRGREAALEINPSRIDFPFFFYPTDGDAERQRRVRITTDAPTWQAEIDPADSWLQVVSQSADELVLTAPDNQYAERTAAVTIRAGSTAKTLTVVQQSALVPYDGFEGEYTASGSPSVWNGTVNEGPGTWTSVFVPGFDEQDGPYYIADNFGGKGTTLPDARIFIHWLQGRPTIYSPLPLGFKSREGIDAYQLLFIIKEDGLPYIMEGSQDGTWDPEAGTLDFARVHSLGYDVVVGIVAMAYEQGDPVIKGVFTEGYANLRFARRGTTAPEAVPSRTTRSTRPASTSSRLRELTPASGQRPLSELPHVHR